MAYRNAVAPRDHAGRWPSFEELERCHASFAYNITKRTAQSGSLLRTFRYGWRSPRALSWRHRAASSSEAQYHERKAINRSSRKRSQQNQS